MLSHSKNKSTGQEYTSAASSLKRNGSVLASAIQPKLTIGQPNDKYEQEADRVADQVVRASSVQRGVQKKCTGCEQEEKISKKPLIRRMDQEEEQNQIQLMPEEELQTQRAAQTSEVAPAGVQSSIQQSRGSGSPLPASTRSFMESQIGADFSKVRVHTDSTAHKLNAKLNAQAFASGNDIYFNKGKFNPETRSGKHLLAHELTHTIQQGSSSQKMVQKQEEEHYQFGRAPHYHTKGNWARVQKEAKKNCDRGFFAQTIVKRHLECLCAESTPAEVMKEALDHLDGEGIAERHLKHYLSGRGGELNQNRNLKALIKEDDNVRQWVSYNIAKGLKRNRHEGHFMIQQGHYDEDEYKYAFGGIDRVDWRYNPRSKTVKLWFIDPYDFHPVYGMTKMDNVYTHFGKGDDVIRDTNCVHAAAVEVLKGPDDIRGAKEFVMKGEAVFNIKVFDMDAEEPELNGPGALQEAL